MQDPFKVDFFVVGAMKSGTTSLYHMLIQHPEIAMCAEKEPAFFLLEENLNLVQRLRDRDAWTLQEFSAMFETGKLRGEASTPYTLPPFSVGVAKRIHEHNPDAKIIYLVRNPIDRLVSHYNVSISDKFVSSDLATETVRQSMFTGVSDYATQLKPYRDRFRPENILVLISERLRNDPVATFQQVEQFLGVSSLPDLKTVRANVTPKELKPPRISPRLLRELKLSPTWKTISQATPDGAKNIVRKILYKPAQVQATRDDVPQAIFDYLSDRTNEFRDMIGDPIPEWDT